MNRFVWLVAAVIACLTVGTAFAQEGNEFQLPPVKLRPERPSTAKPIPPTPDERPAPAEKPPETEKPAEPPAPPAEKPAETPKKTPPEAEKPPAPPAEPPSPPPTTPVEPPPPPPPPPPPVEKPAEKSVETPKKAPPVAEKPVKAPKETPTETPKRPRPPKAPLVIETPKEPAPVPAPVAVPIEPAPKPVEPALPPLPPMPAELAQPSPAAPAAPPTPVAPRPPVAPPVPAAPVTPIAAPVPVEPAPVAAPVRELRPEEIQKQVAEAQVGPVSETELAGMGELGLVEEVTRVRRAYARALAALQQYYTSRGMAYKLDWVRTELEAFEKVPKVQYLGVAEIAGPNLKPTRSIQAADQLFTEAMHFKNYPAFPPGKKDYLKLALDKFQALITQFPDSDKIADAAFMMGEIYGGWYFEDWARAVQCYERCWQWDPKTPRPALFNAAKIYEEKLKNRAKAVELYNRVLNESNDQNLVNQARDRIRALTGR